MIGKVSSSQPTLQSRVNITFKGIEKEHYNANQPSFGLCGKGVLKDPVTNNRFKRHILAKSSLGIISTGSFFALCAAAAALLAH